MTNQNQCFGMTVPTMNPSQMSASVAPLALQMTDLQMLCQRSGPVQLALPAAIAAGNGNEARSPTSTQASPTGSMQLALEWPEQQKSDQPGDAAKVADPSSVVGDPSGSQGKVERGSLAAAVPTDGAACEDRPQDAVPAGRDGAEPGKEDQCFKESALDKSSVQTAPTVQQSMTRLEAALSQRNAAKDEAKQSPAEQPEAQTPQTPSTKKQAGKNKKSPMKKPSANKKVKPIHTKDAPRAGGPNKKPASNKKETSKNSIPRGLGRVIPTKKRRIAMVPWGCATCRQVAGCTPSCWKKKGWIAKD